MIKRRKIRGTCQCGGILIIDPAKKQSEHTLPLCAAYKAILGEGKSKFEGYRVEPVSESDETEN